MNHIVWSDIDDPPKVEFESYIHPDKRDRREVEEIRLLKGWMYIDYIAPEEEDNPWDQDNTPMGPQAA